MINTERESLAQWRDNKISSSSNTALIERRIRLAIQEADWTQLSSGLIYCQKINKTAYAGSIGLRGVSLLWGSTSQDNNVWSPL